jgi:hypothetical protein
LKSLGVTFIATSRNEDSFGSEMRRMVGSNGVDVVLNSLSSGNMISKTVELVAPGGRWIELAKRGIWSHNRMAKLRPDIKYETFSLNELIPSEPSRLQRMLRTLALGVEAGQVRPSPMTVSNMGSNLVDAFRSLQSGSIVGKAVVKVSSVAPIRRDGGVAIVTGGLGGLGLITAEVLVDYGVSCIVLASKSGVIKHLNQGLEERLKLLSEGCKVRVVTERCDTAVESEVVAFLERIRREYGAPRVIVHAAGVLADAMISNQTDEGLMRVWGPKADGAWFLHKHTLKDDIENFMLFSSTASLLGNIGQANYSTANAFLDDLARWRTSQGLPAVSVQWPAVTGVGMAAAMDAGVKIDSSLSVDDKTVRMVIAQLLRQVESEPVQSLIPSGMLMPGVLHPSSQSLITKVVRELDCQEPVMMPC